MQFQFGYSVVDGKINIKLIFIMNYDKINNFFWLGGWLVTNNHSFSLGFSILFKFNSRICKKIERELEYEMKYEIMESIIYNVY